MQRPASRASAQAQQAGSSSCLPPLSRLLQSPAPRTGWQQASGSNRAGVATHANQTLLPNMPPAPSRNKIRCFNNMLQDAAKTMLQHDMQSKKRSLQHGPGLSAAATAGLCPRQAKPPTATTVWVPARILWRPAAPAPRWSGPGQRGCSTAQSISEREWTWGSKGRGSSKHARTQRARLQHIHTLWRCSCQAAALQLPQARAAPAAAVHRSQRLERPQLCASAGLVAHPVTGRSQQPAAAPASRVARRAHARAACQARPSGHRCELDRKGAAGAAALTCGRAGWTRECG